MGVPVDGPSTQKQGWTLSEAFERCRDPKQTDLDKASIQFLGLLQMERLIAYGHCRDGAADPERLPGETWRGLLTVTPWREGLGVEQCLFEISGHEICFNDLRIYPVLKAPCAVELLHGLSIAKAFARFVIGDPEFIARWSAGEPWPPHLLGMRNGWMSDEGAPLWPLFDRRWPGMWVWRGNLHVEEADPNSASSEIIDRKDDAFRRTWGTQADRAMTLFEMLRSGLIAAIGDTPNGASTSIRPVWWERKNTWIDFEHGDLLLDDCVGRSPVFRTIVLKRPEPSEPRAHDRQAEQARVPAVRHPMNPSAKSVEWLRRLFEGPKVGTKDQVFDMFLREFPEVSRLQFDNFWKELAPVDWKAPGRPKQDNPD